MAEAAFAAGRPPYLAFLPAFLFAPDPRPLRYIARAWPLALLPSLALAMLVGYAAGGGSAPPMDFPAPLFLALVVLFAPLTETLLMIPILWLLRRFLAPGPAAVGSALVWATLHSLTVPLWGLVVWWPFLILSVAFLAWRERGLWTAVFLVTGIHALQNATIAALSLALS